MTATRTVYAAARRIDSITRDMNAGGVGPTFALDQMQAAIDNARREITAAGRVVLDAHPEETT